MVIEKRVLLASSLRVVKIDDWVHVPDQWHQESTERGLSSSVDQGIQRPGDRNLPLLCHWIDRRVLDHRCEFFRSLQRGVVVNLGSKVRAFRNGKDARFPTNPQD